MSILGLLIFWEYFFPISSDINSGHVMDEYKPETESDANQVRLIENWVIRGSCKRLPDRYLLSCGRGYGHLWNTQYLRSQLWQIQFKVSAHKGMHADLAFWIASASLIDGPNYGYMECFTGFGVIISAHFDESTDNGMGWQIGLLSNDGLIRCLQNKSFCKIDSYKVETRNSTFNNEQRELTATIAHTREGVMIFTSTDDNQNITKMCVNTTRKSRGGYIGFTTSGEITCQGSFNIVDFRILTGDQDSGSGEGVDHKVMYILNPLFVIVCVAALMYISVRNNDKVKSQ